MCSVENGPVNTPVYLINRTTNTANTKTTPFELCFGSKPKMNHLRVFGSLGYAHVTKDKRSKLDPMSYTCMFLGYAENQKGYKVLNVDSGKIEVSRSVILDEREVEGLYQDSSDCIRPPMSLPAPAVDEDEVTTTTRTNLANDEVSDDITMEDVSILDPPALDVDVEMEESQDSLESSGSPLQLRLRDETASGSVSDRLVFHPVANRLRNERSDRLAILPALPAAQTPPQYLLEDSPGSETPRNDSLVLYDEDERDENGTTAASNNESIVVYGRADNDNEPARPSKRLRTDEEALAAMNESATCIDTPKTYEEAIASSEKKKWRQAVAEELNAHDRNGTWQLVSRRADIRPIGCKWVFAKKRNELGQVVRFKARLVAKGFKQQFGVDFFETYSPVANMASIRVFFSLCAGQGYEIEQVDVDTAFLNGVLSDQVYMELPEGLEIDGNVVCKLRKALYGLKQAANVWHKTVRAVFDSMGFTPSGADQCVYVKTDGSGFVYVCLYVDDMLIAAKQSTTIEAVKKALASHFKIKDLGAAKFILGMEVAYKTSQKTLHLTQSQYIRDVIDRFNQGNARGVDNPCDVAIKLSKEHGPKNADEATIMKAKPFRSLMGCLLYIATCTRPDIAFAVCRLSRFLENPGIQHWKAAIRIVRYLKSTLDFGITYSGRSNGELNKVKAYCDADWGSNVDDRRSVSGIMIIMNGGPVVFKAKYQRTAALSSAEAEYMALSLCTQEVLWTRAILHDLGIKQKEATLVLEDNQGAIALANNDGYHARSKHVDIRHHFIRDHVSNGNIIVKYISTEHQAADMLTKGLGTKRFKFVRGAANLFPVRNDQEH